MALVASGSVSIPLVSLGLCSTGYNCATSTLTGSAFSTSSVNALGAQVCKYADGTSCTYSGGSLAFLGGDTTKCPSYVSCKGCTSYIAGKCGCPGSSTPIAGTALCSLQCPSGYFYLASSIICVPCQITVINLSSTLISAGLSIGNYCTATSCSAGNYLSGGICTACASGSVSGGGAAATCTPCVSPLVPSTDKSKCVLAPSNGSKRRRQVTQHRSRQDTWR